MTRNNFVLATIIKKAINKVDKIRLAPIQVFVFHAVVDIYSPMDYYLCDFTNTDTFINLITTLKKNFTFITLEEAKQKMKSDIIRRKHYAVLTCDDGYASTLELLPFLENLKIPLTLFINPAFLFGEVRPDKPEQKSDIYISKEKLFSLNSKWITIGIHGWCHKDTSQMSTAEFEEDLAKSIAILKTHPRFINYYAYAWGKHSSDNDQVLSKSKITPVLCNGSSNRKWRGYINRYCIDKPI